MYAIDFLFLFRGRIAGLSGTNGLRAHNGLVLINEVLTDIDYT